jgi:hypothetical protein
MTDTTPDANRSIKRAGVLLGILVVLGAGLLWWLLTHDPKQPGRVVAKRGLPAVTLLNDADLEMHGSPESLNVSISELTGRYLLAPVNQGAEVTREMVTQREGKEWLSDAVAVAIPMSITPSLGRQLRAGDIIDLVTVPKGATQVKTFENLMVLNIAPLNKDPNASISVTLAVPRGQRDDLALAVSSSELVLTRKLGR